MNKKLETITKALSIVYFTCYFISHKKMPLSAAYEDEDKGI
ncbi:hypothetical protein [Anoxynatronum sibiricum]